MLSNRIGIKELILLSLVPASAKRELGEKLLKKLAIS